TGPIVLPDGSIPAHGRLTVSLTGPDAEGGTQIVMGPLLLPLDAAGAVDATLWCTDAGSAGRVYVGALQWHDGAQTRTSALRFDVPSGSGDLAFVPVWTGDLPQSGQADALAQCQAAVENAVTASGVAVSAAAQAAQYPRFHYPSSATFLASSTAWSPGARITTQTGDVFDVANAGTGDFDHPISGIGLSVVQGAGRGVPIEVFGGGTDKTAAENHAAIQRFLNSAVIKTLLFTENDPKKEYLCDPVDLTGYDRKEFV
ncbi:hypothetical protein CKO11_17085, partial [Rhodobacter sp. TJ_12]|nr:hypothetical protein [Rhodobacter sp. TJ_12]